MESVSPQGAVRHGPRHTGLLTSSSSSSILSPGICSVGHHPQTLCRLVVRLSALFLLPTILGWSGCILKVVICQPNYKLWSPMVYGLAWTFKLEILIGSN